MNIELDEEEYTKQFKQSCEDEGVVVEVYCPAITKESMAKSAGSYAPFIRQHFSNANTLTIGMFILTMERVIERMKKEYAGTEEALAILRLISVDGGTFDFKNGKEDK